MKKTTLWDRIKDVMWYDRINAIEFYFAKRWLDKTFGKQEYWGDYLMENLKRPD